MKLSNEAIAGAGAGVVTSILVCPLDVVKMRLQSQINNTKFPGISKTLKGILREEGIKGWYKGLGPTLFGYFPTWAIYFYVYNKIKRKIIEYTPITNPLWLIRTRIMIQSKNSTYQYRNALDGFRQVYISEGIFGYFKGLIPSLFGVFHVAIQFPLYEFLKWNLQEREPNKQLYDRDIILASVFSKIAASSITYPHEVIRTRLQNQTAKPYKYTGIFQALKLIFAEEKIYGLYKGYSTNVVRVVPSAAITLWTYEQLIKYLSTRIFQALKLIFVEEKIYGLYKGYSTNVVRVVPSAAITLWTYEQLIKYLSTRET
ncbi:Mitochondrial substrate/solute carrier domain-containing protein [Rozella allomycis CSF55]|uniref:Mitochondrial substrate/solute carrier domain-containing protein n=1 Tax=Rozella allomycis (strain CSF55) TaxID=988480 RepID=A0A075ANG4_ROZAC|nr:Mitochondrial substrate/solute carrier domain-containing protein [Rozella allomycis CSF55]|eukprot:EPZ31405.1 Mitochondrial substrate/solute carrier domain-containing protein [Rozella allomycis CSF55]